MYIKLSYTVLSSPTTSKNLRSDVIIFLNILPRELNKLNDTEEIVIDTQWTFYLPNNGDLVLNVAERLTSSGLDCGRLFPLRCNSSLSDEESEELLEESDDEDVELVELVDDWVTCLFIFFSAFSFPLNFPIM